MLKARIKKRLGSFQLDVRLEAGEGITGILGPSGCGKSVTLRCIAGVETPDSGRIELDGVTLFDSHRRINLPPQRRKVGYLFQSYALFPNMTVEQNILCGLKQEKDGTVRMKALEQAVAMLRLEGLERHRPVQLSGGQAQRVALARILVSRPRLLMLDEPFSALDSDLRDEVCRQTKNLLEQVGGNTLMVSHSREEVYRLCGDVALMKDGSFLTHRPTKELFADPATVAGAQLTGIRNILPAVKSGPHTVEVTGWGMGLTTARPVEDHVCAVAVRSHAFCAAKGENRFVMDIVEVQAEPGGWTLRLRCPSQPEDAPDLCWRLPAGPLPEPLPAQLGIPPEEVLLLYPPAEQIPLDVE